MTHAREWTEELVAQYLEIGGHLVLRNLPVGTGRRGGRLEADVVAFRRIAQGVELLDVEVGTYYESPSTIVGVLRKKFTDGRKRYLCARVKAQLKVDQDEEFEYRRVYVDAAWLADSTIAKLREALVPLSVTLKTLGEIVAETPGRIKAWQSSATSEKGSKPELSQSYDYLQIVEACFWAWGDGGRSAP